MYTDAKLPIQVFLASLVWLVLSAQINALILMLMIIGFGLISVGVLNFFLISITLSLWILADVVFYSATLALFVYAALKIRLNLLSSQTVLFIGLLMVINLWLTLSTKLSTTVGQLPREITVYALMLVISHFMITAGAVLIIRNNKSGYSLTESKLTMLQSVISLLFAVVFPFFVRAMYPFVTEMFLNGMDILNLI